MGRKGTKDRKEKDRRTYQSHACLFLIFHRFSPVYWEISISNPGYPSPTGQSLQKCKYSLCRDAFSPLPKISHRRHGEEHNIQPPNIRVLVHFLGAPVPTLRIPSLTDNQGVGVDFREFTNKLDSWGISKSHVASCELFQSDLDDVGWTVEILNSDPFAYVCW